MVYAGATWSSDDPHLRRQLGIAIPGLSLVVLQARRVIAGYRFGAGARSSRLLNLTYFLRRVSGTIGRRQSYSAEGLDRMESRTARWQKRIGEISRQTTTQVIVAVLTAVVLALGALLLKSVLSSRDEQDRAQAGGISGAVVAGPNGAEVEEDPHGGGFTAIVLNNHSPLPVYNVVVSLVIVLGAGPHQGRELGNGSALQRYVATLPPGASEVRVSPGWAGMGAVPGVELGFTDQNGRSWLRYPNGKLVALTKPAASYYKLEQPVGWAAARPLP